MQLSVNEGDLSINESLNGDTTKKNDFGKKRNPPKEKKGKESRRGERKNGKGENGKALLVRENLFWPSLNFHPTREKFDEVFRNFRISFHCLQRNEVKKRSSQFQRAEETGSTTRSSSGGRIMAAATQT